MVIDGHDDVDNNNYHNNENDGLYDNINYPLTSPLFLCCSVSSSCKR